MHAIEEIPDIARKARRLVLKMNYRAKSGHTGADLSEMDILCTLWGSVLQRNQAKDNDRFILSKAHGAGGFYGMLAALGHIDCAVLDTYQRECSKLPGHPVRQKLPDFVEINAGGLGHGLPVAAGLALSKKLQGDRGRVFVLLGDGELAEGSNWEALMFAAKYKLDNLFIIVDRNKLQLASWTEEILPLEPIDEKFRAFRTAVEHCDGNDPAAILACIHKQQDKIEKLPRMIIAATTKGKGVSFIENVPAWHHKVPTDEQLEQALEELN